MEMLVFAFALLFGLFALRDLIALLAAPPPRPLGTALTFIYSFLATLYLAKQSGVF